MPAKSTIIALICAVIACGCGIGGCLTPWATGHTTLYGGAVALKADVQWTYRGVTTCVEGSGYHECETRKYVEHDQYCDSFRAKNIAPLATASLGIAICCFIALAAVLQILGVKEVPQTVYLGALAIASFFFLVTWPVVISLFTIKQCDNPKSIQATTIQFVNPTGSLQFNFGPSAFLFLGSFVFTLAGVIVAKLVGTETPAMSSCDMETPMDGTVQSAYRAQV